MGRHTLSGLSWWSCRAHWPCRTPRYKVIYFMGRYTISVLSSVVVRAHRPCRTPQYKGHLFHEAAHVISVITFHGATHVIGVIIFHGAAHVISVIMVVKTHRPCRPPQHKSHLFHGAAHIISVITLHVAANVISVITFHGATHVISVIIFHGAAHVIGVIMVVRTHRPCRPPQYIYPMGHDTCRSGQGSLAVTYATVHSPHGDVTRVTVAVT